MQKPQKKIWNFIKNNLSNSMKITNFAQVIFLKTCNSIKNYKNGILFNLINIHKLKIIKILNLYPKSHFWLCAVCLKNLSLHRFTLYYDVLENRKTSFLAIAFEVGTWLWSEALREMHWAREIPSQRMCACLWQINFDFFLMLQTYSYIYTHR